MRFHYSKTRNNMLYKVLSFITILIILINTNTYKAFSQMDEFELYDFYEHFVKPDIPPAPDAAALGRYVEMPVSLYAGVSNISIPLYGINTGGYSLPISISYHASGNKITDPGSWVGLGWSLNAGGVITRSVKGIPDDLYNTMFDNGQEWVTQGKSGYLYNAIDDDPYFNNLQNKLKYLSRGNLDGEPDIFFFNFNGISGRFVFDKSGNARIFSKQNFKIDYIQRDETGAINPNGLIAEFIITTDDGIKYKFDQYERTIQKQGLSQNVNIDDGPFGFYPVNQYGYLDKEFNSSWYLSEIVLQNDQEISFEYEDEYYQNLGFPSKTKGMKCLPTGGGGQNCNVSQDWTNSIMEIAGKRLTKISWSAGHIDFNATKNRDDIIEKWQYKGETDCNKKALTEIQVFNNVSNNPVKSYKFNTSYLFSDGINDVGYDHKFAFIRLMLNSIEETNTIGSSSLLSYSFSYNSTLLPSKYSFEQDFWGYYNANGDDLELFPTIYQYYDVTENSVHNSQYSIYRRASGDYTTIPGVDRTPKIAFAKACILERIDYPAGGYREFDYELNTFLYEETEKKGGGLRIKEIRAYSDETEELVQNYYYTDENGVCSGRILNIPQFASYVPELYPGVWDAYSGEELARKQTKFYSTSAGELGSTKGSFIGYETVTEHKNSEGYTIREFDIPAPYGVAKTDYQNGEYVYERPVTSIYSTLADKNNNCFPFCI